MQKPKAYTVVGTNIEQLGTELEKQCKETAAATESEWQKVGKEPGLLIWRIENFKVVPVHQSVYGQFYDGDSYIVLHTQGKPGNFHYDIHFWLGEHTTIDEAGTAVYKTVELYTYLKEAPVQHREVQNSESALFLSYFPNGLRILEGGVPSAFVHVTAAEYKPRLLQVTGTRNHIRAVQVPLARDSLNTGDVFILDNGLIIYQWNGSKSNGQERIKAAQLCRAIADDEREGKAAVVVLEESDPQEDFWNALGGFGPVKPRPAAPEVPPVTKRLFKISDASGTLQFTEVASGVVHKSALNDNDVFLFDTGEHIFIWVSKGADKKEKDSAMGFAKEYIEQHNRPDALPISRLVQGGNNLVWEAAFD